MEGRKERGMSHRFKKPFAASKVGGSSGSLEKISKTKPVLGTAAEK
jgi:hypothetical protein